MKLANTSERFGLVHVLIHWATVILVTILFPLGLIMVGLDYYDAGYHKYPPIHKALGVILLCMTLFRLLWVILLSMPRAITDKKIEFIAAKAVHGLMYLLILLIGVSGYLISTADGRGIEVFGLFTVPALFEPLANQADIAGRIHLFTAWGLVAMIVLHILGALKHQLIDKDRSLVRIFGR